MRRPRSKMKSCNEELAKIVINSMKGVNLQEDWRKAVKYAKINEVAIPVLRYLKEEGLCSEHDLIQLFNKEVQRYCLFWQNVTKIAQLFSKEGIEYTIIKTRRVYEFYDWDIDVLVKEEDWPNALRLLEAHCFKRARTFSHPLASIESGKLLLEREGGFPIHLHKRISWYGLECLPSELVLSSSVEIKGVYYPSEAVDALIYCAHSVFEGYGLTLGEVYHFVKTTNNSIHDLILSLANENGWLEGARLSIKAMEEVWNALNNGERVKLPYRYEFRSLLRAWNQHARERGLGLYEMFINSFECLLKRYNGLRLRI
jgi:hypothetical protein